MYMGIKVDVTGPDKLAERVMKNAAFATSWAINKTIPRTQKYLRRRMNTQLDGGAMAFSKRGLQYERANYKASNLMSRKVNTGVIYFAKDRFYMEEVVYGGRKPARNKYLPEPVKKNIRLTKTGNIPRNFQQQAALNQRSTGFARIDRKARGTLGLRAEKRFKNIFVGRPERGGKPFGPYGVWRRGRGDSPPKLMIMYRRRSRQQKQIWPAHEAADKHFRRFIKINMAESYRKYIAPRGAKLQR